MNGVQHYGEVLFNGHPPPPTSQQEFSPPPPSLSGGSTLAGGAGTTGANSAASQAAAIVSGADAGQAANTAAATAAESPAASPASSTGGQASADAAAAGAAAAASGGNEKGGAPSNLPDGGAGAAGATAGGGYTATGGATVTGPALGNNCFLLPSLCPQYSAPFPGIQGAGANVVHVDGDPKEPKANDGSQPEKVIPAANIQADAILGPIQAPLPADPPPPTPAPYSANLKFDTSMDNGAAGMGEGIQVDTSADASFVGGAPVQKLGRPTQLLALPKLQTMAEIKSRLIPASGLRWSQAGLLSARRPRYPVITLSNEFEDTEGGDTSMDGELQDVDEQLRKLLPAYDQVVGTVNFGSRGMTDKRNDFLEGTSGSEFGGPASSAGDSKQGSVSALFALLPTGMKVLTKQEDRGERLEDRDERLVAAAQLRLQQQALLLKRLQSEDARLMRLDAPHQGARPDLRHQVLQDVSVGCWCHPMFVHILTCASMLEFLTLNLCQCCAPCRVFVS